MESALREGADQPGLTLIETLGWTGTEFPRLGLHMARLARSAALLGWAVDPVAAQAALRASVPLTPARMRLTLNRAGTLAVEAAALPATKPTWQLILAPVP